MMARKCCPCLPTKGETNCFLTLLLELCWLFHFMTPVCLMPLAGSCRAGVKAGTGLRSLHLATLPISSQGPALRGAPPSKWWVSGSLPASSLIWAISCTAKEGFKPISMCERKQKTNSFSRLLHYSGVPINDIPMNAISLQTLVFSFLACSSTR